MKKYFGLFRGRVVVNDDSHSDRPGLCRVRVDIPEVYGKVTDYDVLPWAWPSLPAFGGPRVETNEGVARGLDAGTLSPSTATKTPEYVTHGVFAVPPVGACVWVLFEQGDAQVPVYFGTWVGARENAPLTLKKGYPKNLTIKTPYRRNMYINFNGADNLEIVFGDMVLRFSSFDSGSFWGESNQKTTNQVGQIGRVDLQTARSNIYLDSVHGNILIRGRKVTIQGREKVQITGGVWGPIPSVAHADPCVYSQGSIEMTSTDGVKIFANGKASLQSRTSWSCGAPTASGFDKHVGQPDPSKPCEINSLNSNTTPQDWLTLEQGVDPVPLGGS